MKKTISVVLALVFVFMSFSVIAGAAGTYYVALPSVEGKTMAVADIITNAVISGDPATADYTFRYDSSVYTDISAIPENTTFEFDVVLNEKYNKNHFYLFANGAHITLTDRNVYAIYMDRNIALTLPETGSYKNFILNTYTIIKYTSSVGLGGGDNILQSSEGFHLFTFHPEDVQNAQTTQGTWGEDYYIKIILDDGYRKCLDGIESDSEIDIKLPIGVTVKAKGTIKDMAIVVEPIGELYIDSAKKHHVDYYDATDDDISAAAGYTKIGRVYVIDGQYVKSNMNITVSGVFTDSVVSIITWFYRIIRVISHIFGGTTTA